MSAIPPHAGQDGFLSTSERALLLEVARAALPGGRVLPAAGEQTALRAEAFIASLGSFARQGYRGLLRSLELASAARFGRTFASLPLGRRLSLLDGWRRSEAMRLALRALLTPIKLGYFDDPAVHATLGCRYAIDPPAQREPKRWESQVVDGTQLPADETLECDAVVVGTGAGGAPVAKELAEAGYAVLLVEEGEYVRREEFSGRPVEMMRRLYRDGGFTMALGNTAIPVAVGRSVGGTTTINAGTSLRAPEAVLRSWVDEHGLTELSTHKLDFFYSRVEAVLGVAEATPAVYGAPGRLIARGCDALGYSHRPLRRNAPDCDGQGLCCFGCPTDAKRSTNVSYVPLALERSAQLLTGLKVERVLVERETAVGVAGRARRADGTSVTVTVRAKVVVLACGALHTPALLLANGLANASGELGKNLSIHPAGVAMGLFDEPVNSWSAAPQGYSIDHFASEGILFEGGSAPLELTSATLPGFGPDHMETMERFDRSLVFGFLVKDVSRGRVRVGQGGRPRLRYWLGEPDRARLQRGMALLCRVFFAAGAQEVRPGVAGWERLRDVREVDALDGARIPARHFDLTAYHPLGTARLGNDPLRSVVDATHETHDVHNLFVCDGSAVPSSLGVNPQLTIMALATRASGFIARRLERLNAA